MLSPLQRPSLPLWFLAVFLAATGARAQTFTQSSPGELAQSHAQLEGQDNCVQCHTDGKNLDNNKCLGCHDHQDLKARIDAGKGYHATTKVQGKKCWDCHSDHKKKSFDLMGWKPVGGRDAFDHGVTEFPLRGKHQAIKCDDCHKRTNKAGLKVYMSEDKNCGRCHKDDQKHGFERTTHQDNFRCERCHNDISWKPPKSPLEFDHNDKKLVSFPLEGSHKDVACQKCHAGTVFKLTQDTTTCAACHPNVHVGQLFETKTCDSCHSPKLGSLAKVDFAHDKRTKFELDGKHRQASCYKCHPTNQKRKPSMECGGCHAKDSHHKDRFREFGSPPLCSVCHSGGSQWEPNAFNHDQRTNFKLQGTHGRVGCRDCHRGKDPSVWERFDASKVGCMGCHQHKTVHKRQYKDSECLNCHKTGGSLQGPKNLEERYHGPSSRFPLKFEHKSVECKKCHKGDNWKGLKRNCGPSCHQDTLHKGALGFECEGCHSGGTWEALNFDHDVDSDYKLVGNHAPKKKKATCEGCHPNRLYKPTPRSCGAEQCHAKDDPHKQRLGDKCERCHKETGENIFNHNKQAQFKLDGAHLEVNCKSCHPSVKFRPRPKDCFGCHPEPNVHKGMYGTTCNQCHNTKAWEQINAIHDVGDFSLAGSHDKIACVRCHKDSRPLAGTGTLCLTCHREDDIHGNSLGPKCGDCHTQWAFAPARFDHTTVGCDLQGQHRTFACFQCHRSGNYGGLTGDCFGCHRNDALREANSFNPPTSDPNGHLVQTQCGTCHNLNYWPGALTEGRDAFRSSTVCR